MENSKDENYTQAQCKPMRLSDLTTNIYEFERNARRSPNVQSNFIGEQSKED